jgi:hypothetical protein
MRLFAQHIVTFEPQNFILKRSTKNRKGKFIWAELDPANWQLLVTGEDPVALFEFAPPSEESFIHGTVYLLLGRRVGGKTQWTTANGRTPTRVDRPLSHEVC